MFQHGRRSASRGDIARLPGSTENLAWLLGSTEDVARLLCFAEYIAPPLCLAEVITLLSCLAEDVALPLCFAEDIVLLSGPVMAVTPPAVEFTVPPTPVCGPALLPFSTGDVTPPPVSAGDITLPPVLDEDIGPTPYTAEDIAPPPCFITIVSPHSGFVVVVTPPGLTPPDLPLLMLPPRTLGGGGSVMAYQGLFCLRPPEDPPVPDVELLLCYPSHFFV